MMGRAALLAVLLASATALALTQPNGAAIPAPPGCNGGKPDGLGAVFACVCDQPGVCNIGAPCASQTSCDDGKHAQCETTLWHSFNDNTCIPSNLSGLDPAKDASLTPETYHPSCALTFTVVTRGGALFHDVFGWYNATGKVPDASDLHVMLDCNAPNGKSVVLDVKNDPAYKGGDIGFFLLSPEQHGKTGACAGGDCCATLPRLQKGEGYAYYSERALNPDAAGAQSFIHLLVYDSKLTARKFYFAWEDIFGGSNNTFTDLVTSVEGVECSGAGATCATGMKGECGRGLSTCANGVVSCAPLVQPAAERCNGVDDDCNGAVDDGALCPDGQMCVDGRCVGHCATSSEFACPPDLVCDGKSGLCNDPTCANVQCADGQVCRGGKCTGACDGITCPHQQVCRLGSCLDPCAGVSCAAGQVCREGVCLPGCSQCGGISCGGGLSCDAGSGACLDLSCASPCPTGTYCQEGSCKDACAGAVCPTGQVCTQGACVPAGTSPGGSGSTVGGSADQPGGGGGTRSTDGGCACAAGARPSNGSRTAASLFALVVLAGLLRRRF